jgi:FG-GAP-like repeat
MERLRLIGIAVTLIALGPRPAMATFCAAVLYGSGTGPINVATADLNGDGRLDIIVPNFGADTVSVLLGNGDGTFGLATDFPTGEPFRVSRRPWGGR